MDRSRKAGWWLSVVLWLIPGVLAGPGIVHPAGQAAVITEIQLQGGQADVRRMGVQGWQPAGPLLRLGPGDTVRVSGNAVVVVLLTGGRGTVKVDASNSPFEVAARPPEKSQLSRGWILLEDSIRALLKGSRDSADVSLGTRGSTRTLSVLVPDNGVLLPDSLVFEWTGGELSRQAIRVSGPSGPVLERHDFVGTSFVYPADASALVPGIRYEFRVSNGTEPAAAAWFQVAQPAKAEAIRHDLADLKATVGSTVSPNTLVLAQVAYLVEQGFIVDARLMVQAALVNQPNDQTFRFLLGNFYERLGLSKHAAESLVDARFRKGPTER